MRIKIGEIILQIYNFYYKRNVFSKLKKNSDTA